MTWVRVDDDLFSHPKFTDAWEREPASVGLWLLGASYSGRHLLDGLVPRRFVDQWFKTPVRERRATEALVDTRLWVPNGDGWEIHDWGEHNPTRESVLARRASDSKRKRAGR